MRAVIRYPGSKWSIADWIISFFHDGYEKMVYLEPFAGSAAVFFNKKPGAVETINDLDGEVVNLFQVLRANPKELKRLLALTPYSRAHKGIVESKTPRRDTPNCKAKWRSPLLWMEHKRSW